MASRPAQVGWLILRSVLRVLWISTMVLTPLFGFWLASSFAAYQNASQWLALLGGLVMFPIIPLGWDLFFVWRRSKQETPRKAILTRLDRLVLRTLLVNGLFIFCMLFFARTTSVRALAVRGDWIVDGHHGPIANGIRGFLLAFADRFDRKTATDHYGDSDDAPDPSTIKPPPEPERPIDPTSTVKPPKFDTGWPFDATVDPLVSGMPADAQASIETVGAYLRDKFPDRKLRAKAIHDFVALRLTYDDAALKLIIARDYKNVPSQKAEDVFAAKVGVCEGYARLMTALGTAASVEIKYVTGYIRDAQRR
ncbi:MAG TPA: transglutaminase-like domain-containing protein, partial [Kofleriaceae bacterium]